MQRSNQPPTPAVQALTAIVPVNKGGTGAANVFDAATNLGGVNKSKLGAASGLALGDSSGNVPTSLMPDATVVGPTLSGSNPVSAGQTSQFVVSNYDSLTNYTVSASAGTISMTGDTITYTAPGTPGAYTITVNGKVFNVTVSTARPAKPTLAASTSGNASVASIAFTGSAFAMQVGNGTHASSDWELYSDPNLTNLVASSLIDTVNKIGWTTTGLALTTTYYGRARYRDSNGGVSDWASVLPVTTLSDYLPTSEEAKLPQLDTTTTTTETIFMKLVSIDNTGTRVAVGNWSGHPTGSGVTGQGVVYVYLRTGGTWALEQKLTASDATTNAYFGQGVTLTADGTRLVVGAFNKTVTYSIQGAAYVFVRNTSTNVWTQEQILVAGDAAAASEYYGYAATIDATGSRIVIGAEGNNGSRGAAYVYSRVGSTWSQEQKLVASDAATSNFYGVSVAMTPDGTRIIVGSFSANTGAAASGAAYIYSRTNNTWTQEAKIAPADPVTNGYFGGQVAIDSTGLRVVVASQNRSDSPTSSNGAVYIFLRSGTSWAVEQKIMASNKANSDLFGSSVAINSTGSTVIVGSYKSDPSSIAEAGSVYIYNRSGTTWTETTIVTASDKAAANGFGTSVAATPDGTRMVVATTHRTNFYLLAAYIYS